VSAPLRVAVIGAGPAGFYVAESVLSGGDAAVSVDVFDKLPTPFGLVRQGVAPDHQKIKSVTRAYDRIAARPGFRFFGAVEFGVHLSMHDLRAHYHQVCFATGAQSDRRLGIPGEDLAGSHAATDFVAWYNGHPGYLDHAFDLSADSVTIIGVGNVALDVARILCRRTDELEKTDIADHALDGPSAIARAHRRARRMALRDRVVERVTLIGRRGPAQAAFSVPELREILTLPELDIVVDPGEVAVPATGSAAAAAPDDREARQKATLLEEQAARPLQGHARVLAFRFYLSPIAVVGDAAGHVTGVRFARTRLEPDPKGDVRAVATGEEETIPSRLVFRSVGYRGVALPGVAFDEARGTIPNERGRVTETNGGDVVPGLYVAGWIKRGPSGVIGTNKPDALETAEAMATDRARGVTLSPVTTDPAALEQLVRERQPGFISYDDWKRLDAIEIERGRRRGRPRVKFATVDEMLAALRGETPSSGD
jgi:ferredoxin--NADP+ reductase